MGASILGHMYSPWVGFKGGKGVATGLGAAMGIYPYLAIPACAAFGVWFSILRARGYVSLASIIAALMLPVAVAIWALVSAWRTPDHADVLALHPFYAVTTLLAVMVVWRHRANIGRLRAGTENRFAPSRPPQD
jgi:glycerol-3-phosphate acyltransferase PlsY